MEQQQQHVVVGSLPPRSTHDSSLPPSATSAGSFAQRVKQTSTDEDRILRLNLELRSLQEQEAAATTPAELRTQLRATIAAKQQEKKELLLDYKRALENEVSDGGSTTGGVVVGGLAQALGLGGAGAGTPAPTEAVEPEAERTSGNRFRFTTTAGSTSPRIPRFGPKPLCSPSPASSPTWASASPKNCRRRWSPQRAPASGASPPFQKSPPSTRGKNIPSGEVLAQQLLVNAFASDPAGARGDACCNNMDSPADEKAKALDGNSPPQMSLRKINGVTVPRTSFNFYEGASRASTAAKKTKTRSGATRQAAKMMKVAVVGAKTKHYGDGADSSDQLAARDVTQVKTMLARPVHIPQTKASLLRKLQTPSEHKQDSSKAGWTPRKSPRSFSVGWLGSKHPATSAASVTPPRAFSKPEGTDNFGTQGAAAGDGNAASPFGGGRVPPTEVSSKNDTKLAAVLASPRLPPTFGVPLSPRDGASPPPKGQVSSAKEAYFSALSSSRQQFFQQKGVEELLKDMQAMARERGKAVKESKKLLDDNIECRKKMRVMEERASELAEEIASTTLDNEEKQENIDSLHALLEENEKMLATVSEQERERAERTAKVIASMGAEVKQLTASLEELAKKRTEVQNDRDHWRAKAEDLKSQSHQLMRRGTAQEKSLTDALKAEKQKLEVMEEEVLGKLKRQNMGLSAELEMTQKKLKFAEEGMVKLKEEKEILEEQMDRLRKKTVAEMNEMLTQFSSRVREEAGMEMAKRVKLEEEDKARRSELEAALEAKLAEREKSFTERLRQERDRWLAEKLELQRELHLARARNSSSSVSFDGVGGAGSGSASGSAGQAHLSSTSFSSAVLGAAAPAVEAPRTTVTTSATPPGRVQSAPGVYSAAPTATTGSAGPSGARTVSVAVQDSTPSPRTTTRTSTTRVGAPMFDNYLRQIAEHNHRLASGGGSLRI